MYPDQETQASPRSKQRARDRWPDHQAGGHDPGTGGLDITVALAVHAAITKVRAQTAPKVKIIRSVGTDLDVGILVS
jgi:hypothetical protein